ncbi:MAG: sulfotransferase, partial [Planctomycetia bacterium]|nr:sulfotransferase [Planctomycetia bacterium]
TGGNDDSYRLYSGDAAWLPPWPGSAPVRLHDSAGASAEITPGNQGSVGGRTGSGSASASTEIIMATSRKSKNHPSELPPESPEFTQNFIVPENATITQNVPIPREDAPPCTDTGAGGYRDRPWYPRAWNGMPLEILWRIAVRNGFRVTHVPRFFACSLTAAFSSSLAALQSCAYGRRIARTELSADPIFILGHWRSGTTLLHELMIRDGRFTYPTTYQCGAPLHHLVSQSWLSPLVSKLMPDKRPMDNMRFGVTRPQEDEFALCCLGNRSPYLSIMYPNRPVNDAQYLTMEGLSPDQIRTWKEGFLRFLRSLAVRDPRPIVLKSPPHTARVRVLLEMFPEAKFIHIVRDPYALFPSTRNLWKRLCEDYGFQFPDFRQLDEHVFRGMELMYAAFERDRPLIPTGHFAQVRYETLVKDKSGEMERIYTELGLGEADRVRPAVRAYLDENSGFRKNRFDPLPEELRERIATRWRFYFDTYDYPT